MSNITHLAAREFVRLPTLSYADEFMELFRRREALTAERDAIESRLVAMAAIIEAAPLSTLRLPSGARAVFRHGRLVAASIKGGRLND